MPKSRFNEIKDVIAKANESKLMTRLDGSNITLKNAEKLLEVMISGKINKKKARDINNDIAEDVNKLNKLKSTESRKIFLPIFKQLEEIFMWCKADEEVDGEGDDEVDDETDMSELESEKSAAQPILSRLPISLAQLQARNNSQKLKNEIDKQKYCIMYYCIMYYCKIIVL